MHLMVKAPDRWLRWMSAVVLIGGVAFVTRQSLLCGEGTARESSAFPPLAAGEVNTSLQCERNLETLQDGLAEPVERMHAAEWLAKHCSAGCLDSLLELLAGDDQETLVYAAVALGRMGPAAKSAVDRLLVLGRDGDFAARQAALMALSQIAPETEAVFDVVRDALHAPHPAVRRAAADSLNSLASQGTPLHAEILQLLRSQVESSEEGLRMAAVEGLLAAHPADPADVERLLNHQESTLRIRTAVILSGLPTQAMPATARLVQMSLSPRNFERMAAWSALRRLGSQILPGLHDVIASSAPLDVRTQAAVLAANFEPQPSVAVVRQLQEGFRELGVDPQWRVRVEQSLPPLTRKVLAAAPSQVASSSGARCPEFALGDHSAKIEGSVPREKLAQSPAQLKSEQPMHLASE